jgi:hypothetical protein
MASAKKPLHVFESKLGTAKGVARSRIWIEGKRLVDAGFTVGQYFIKEVFDESHGKARRLELVLLKDDDVLDTAPAKVSGKGKKPIIDITGHCVREVFAPFDKVKVTYYPGRIVITGAE